MSFHPTTRALTLLVAAILAMAPGVAIAADPPGAKQQSMEEEAASIVTDPIEDVNIQRKDIPAELTRIRDAPYALDEIKDCEAILREIATLEVVLGPDVDDVGARDAKRSAGRTAVTVVKGVIGSLIPFRGLVREVSGANKAEREYNQAIYAGVARRSYLKGTAKAWQCEAPKLVDVPK